MPAASDMSRPPATYSPSLAPSAPTMMGPPAAAPGPSSGPPRTFAPGAPGAPAAPSAPGGGSSGAFYRVPNSNEASRSVEPLRIQNIPPVNNGPQLSPTPSAHPENENRTTSRPVLQATYFQLLQSPPAAVPAQTISAPGPTARPPVDDSGWEHAD